MILITKLFASFLKLNATITLMIGEISSENCRAIYQENQNLVFVTVIKHYDWWNFIESFF